MEKFMTTEVII